MAQDLPPHDTLIRSKTGLRRPPERIYTLGQSSVSPQRPSNHREETPRGLGLRLRVGSAAATPLVYLLLTGPGP